MSAPSQALKTQAPYFVTTFGVQTVPVALHDLNLARMERTLICEALHRVCGMQSFAAGLLGVTRRQLRRRIVKHGIVVPTEQAMAAGAPIVALAGRSAHFAQSD